MPESAVTNLICEERMERLREETRVCLHDQESRTREDMDDIKSYIKWGIAALFGIMVEVSMVLLSYALQR